MVLRNVECPASILNDGLHQHAALLFGPVQTVFLGKPQRARDFGIQCRWRHHDIGAVLNSLGWVRRGISAVAHGCGAGCFGDEALLEIVQAREVPRGVARLAQRSPRKAGPIPLRSATEAVGAAELHELHVTNEGALARASFARAGLRGARWDGKDVLKVRAGCAKAFDVDTKLELSVELALVNPARLMTVLSRTGVPGFANTLPTLPVE